MTAHEALLMAEEQILKARQEALDKSEKQPDEIGRLAWDTAALSHMHDAKVCRAIRESLPK